MKEKSNKQVNEPVNNDPGHNVAQSHKRTRSKFIEENLGADLNSVMVAMKGGKVKSAKR